jgi:hypothetical protein
MTWDAQTVASLGRSRMLHFDDYLRRGEKAKTDADSERRRAMRECRFCYYVSHGLAGQAFTEYACCACKEPHMHSNTSVPKLCDGCADRLGACVRCGGTREWQPVELNHAPQRAVRR